MLKTILLLLVALLNVTMGLLVVIRDWRKTINIWFAALAVSCAAWVAGIAGFYMAEGSDAQIAWARFYYLAPLLLVACSVIVADLFPSGTKIRRMKFWVMIIGLLLLGIPLINGSFLIQGLAYHSWGTEVLLNRPQYLLYSAYIVLGFYWMLSSLRKKSRTERGLIKTQAEVFFYGTLGSAILGTLFNLFLPWFGNYQLIWIGPIATNIYIATTLYSIVKHKLFDIRLVIARSMAYLLALSALGSVYGVLTFVMIARVLPDTVDPNTERAMFTALAVVTAITFPITKRFFDRVTNKFFYRDAYDPQVLIDHLNKVLVTNTALETMLEEAAEVIATNIKAQYCLFGIKETKFMKRRVLGTTKRSYATEDIKLVRNLTSHVSGNVIVSDYLEQTGGSLRKVLDKNDIVVFIKLRTSTGIGEEGLGYIVLGAKRSGNPYTTQDIKILDILSKELSIAIQNTLHYEEIENFNRTLQEKIDEATRKLRRTNEKLRQLDQTKDDFISMASHQLRTPLTSVKGYVSMVLDGDAGKVNHLQRKLLTQSFVSSQRMVYLISDLLNVSRLRTGKFVIEPSPTNLAKVIKDEIEQLEDTAKGRGLTLAYNKPEHFPTLMLDETKIRQVIMNFMDNAIYYTPSGGHITINLLDKPESVEFTVVDDGIGVPKPEQHHLFTKFYRAHNAKRARPDGTGLGLFMARKVVVAQGGAIIFKSAEGRGSTFGFSFVKSRLQVQAGPTALSGSGNHSEPIKN